jgi:hypothetical protein
MSPTEHNTLTGWAGVGNGKSLLWLIVLLYAITDLHIIGKPLEQMQLTLRAWDDNCVEMDVTHCGMCGSDIVRKTAS